MNIALDAVNPTPWELTEENKERIDRLIEDQNLLPLCICSGILEICKGNEPYSQDYLICPFCDSTYCLSERENT